MIMIITWGIVFIIYIGRLQAYFYNFIGYAYITKYSYFNYMECISSYGWLKYRGAYA